MSSDNEVLLLSSVKLTNFLSTNQLVQANALQCKIEAILKKEVFPPGVIKPEEHKRWGAYHSAIKIRNYILSGSTAEALRSARELGAQL